MPAIKDNLKTLRTDRGLSQSEAAEALHVTRQTISSYETGRTEPDLETLKRFAELYHADIHDVLYGGNQAGRKLTQLRWAVTAVAAVLLLSLLAHSIMYLVINTCYVVPNGTSVTDQNIDFIHTRFAVRNAADIIAAVGTGLFNMGCLMLIYPLIAVRKIYPPKKMLLWLLGLIIAILAVTLPFSAADKVFGWGDYLVAPAFSTSLPIALVFIVIIILILVKRRSGREEQQGIRL